MLSKKYILIFFLLIIGADESFLFAQNFNSIRSKYENFEENNDTALPFVKKYIDKAKKEKDYPHLSQGYLDAGYYNSNINLKFKYADSAILSAKFSNDNQRVVTAYMVKGTLYYFYYKKYKIALNEYVKAFDYAKKIDDEYQQYTIMYHMGVVKSYLGYYNEALDLFKNCITYFEPSTKGNLHPNLIYNNKKGYYNTLHQTIICYRNLGNFKKADSLIRVGLNKTSNSKEFTLERSYFFKCKGVVDYHNKSYKESIALLKKALPEIKKNKDFTWVSVSYFYIGKSYLGLKHQKEAIENFIKVDSIFQKHNFILPELRENYELLIRKAKEKGDTKQELYYTKNLLKADSIISKDFNYLSSKIHREYDTQQLIDAKDSLENQKHWGIRFTVFLLIVALVLSSVLYYNNLIKKKIEHKYFELEKKILNRQSIVPTQNIEIIPSSKSNSNNLVFNEILKKLEKFEEKNKFTEKGLTLNKLAKNFNTNSTYLSLVISENRNLNFNKYLSELRINYITQKLYNDREYLKYTVETLAEKCGMASRQNFSGLFQEINGIRPTDFVKQRKKEMEEKEREQGGISRVISES